jgi:lipopolysaccharide/colanic/teichoic acid biosynthesis glycosyltransferase
MLIQLPSGSSGQQGSTPEASNAFEEGLRRDLASAPMVSYDSMLGGWSKRAVEFALTLLSAPIWLSVLLLAAGVAKLRHRAPVFVAHERIGYGGRTYRCFALRMDAPSTNVVRLQAEPETPVEDLPAIAEKAESRPSKWRGVIERLPQLLNVIRGDMAIVGPSPLTREELEPLKSARRYYLSARPGIVGVSAIADSDDGVNQYKIYAMSWSFATDVLIVWDALRSLQNRGELWKPGIKLAKRGETPVVVRRRSSGG